ncbi:MAG: DUF1587 domain-containing protein, partial [Pirellulaceae bacterium]|nr:DUF1587 domain-containing protein [Pirellulaceae bacterium]
MATFTSIRLHPIATAATLALSIAGAIRAEAAPERSKEVRSFLARYCYDCHGEETREGKLRLDDLSVDVEVDGQRWLGVLRKLEAGEMPPEDEQQPPAADSLRVTQWISRSLIAVNRRQQETEGRVVLRRLNRVEYENTIRDLLAIDIDVKDLLPEDAKAHGFDNIGAALNISSVLLERYLEAADAALTEAMTAGPRPESIKMRVSYKDERRVKDHESYLPLDDALVFFSAGYSPTEVNQFRAPRKGLYRVRVSAYAYQSERPVTFRAYGGINEKRHLAGYFDAQTTPTEVEFTTRLGRRNTIRIVPYGTRLKKWNDAARETGPGLAVQWVEIEGPLIEQWSPESHRRLFSDLPVEDLNAEARKRNRRLQPLHEVVSKDPAQDARRIFQRMLPKMFRRPVTGSEIDQYLDIVLAQLENGYRFQEAVRVGLKTALCSPDFLYLMERRGAPLDQFQVASRLSYFLWSTTPDEELVSLADDGKLRDRATLRRQTERMLNDPRAAAF